MLPLSVLTLALLGGFVFATRWYPTRYLTLRSEGYRLLFFAAIFAAGFLFVAALAQALSPNLVSESIDGPWKRVLPDAPKGLGRATIAFLTGTLLWYPANLLGKWSRKFLKDQPESKFSWFWKRLRFLSDEAAIYRAIKGKNDPLETFLYDALYHLARKRKILITVKNGKVYIGILQEIFNPAFPITSIGMVLRYSGHRLVGTQQMNIDVDYAHIIRDRLRPRLIQSLLPILTQSRFEELLRENPNMDDEELVKKATSEFSPPGVNEALRQEMEAKLEIALEVELEVELENYQIVIPLTEIQSVNFFDENVHEDYKKYFTPAPATDCPPKPRQAEVIRLWNVAACLRRCLASRRK